jgi:ribonuclease T1
MTLVRSRAAPARGAIARMLLGALALLVLVFIAQAKEPARYAEIAVEDMPKEAQQVLSLIRKGGPFAYRQDGTIFGNREHSLPARSHGTYREYTVATPGARDRGARRIVAGTDPGSGARGAIEFWYTDDHYKSFRRIRE